MNINSIYIILLVSIVLSCKSDKEEFTFQINGNLKNFDEEVIVLQRGEAADAKTILIAEKKKGSFHFKSKEKLEIDRYFIKIGNELKRVPILIDNSNISVYLDPNDLSKSYTKGTTAIQKNYNKFLEGCKSTDNLFAYKKRFIEENKHSFLGALALKDLLGPTQWRLKQSLMLYEQLDSTIQSSDLGKEINNYITNGFENMVETDEPEVDEFENEQIEKAIKDAIEAEENPNSENQTTISKPEVVTKPAPVKLEYVPYFYGDGVDGIEVSAKNVFSKNKVTLIDFWASWCVPCRAQNPDYVRLYNKYHSQGFEILSIASDKKTGDWHSAIATDNMNWIHVIDPYNRIANTYNVGAIPHAILVNSQGGILAKEPGISSIENLLRENLRN